MTASARLSYTSAISGTPLLGDTIGDNLERSVARHGDEVAVAVEANAFLHHMVRNIVGSLLMVGRGERPVGWIGELLAGGDRTVAGPTAPAAGLLFVGPLYPPQCGLPPEVSGDG